MVAEHLERTRDAFVAATDGLSEAQYRFTTGDGAWSIGEIVEHVAIVERRILDMLGKMPAAAAPTAGKRVGPERFARLTALVPTRDQRRIEAPTPLRPTGSFASAAAALAAFLDVRGESIAAAQAAPPDVCDRVLPHRGLGELDLEEWLWFLALHSARHVEQVDEIKRAAGYPA
jgi:hypothetical protein